MKRLPFKTIKTLKTRDLKAKFVLVRADFNVPIKNGKVADDNRLRAAVPTLEYLRARGAKVLVMSHLGRKGTETLAPVARALDLHIKVGFSKLIFDEKRFVAMPNGSIMLLENLRRHEEEEKNDKKFAQRLAALADVYVNDAFSASHRAHASVVGVPKCLPSFAGLAFAKEYEELAKVLKPPRPFLVILGGAKFDTKLPALFKLLPKADTVFIGGALAHALWRKLGYELGKSLVDRGPKGLSLVLKNKKVILPADVVVKNLSGRVVKKPEEVRRQDNIQDAGPATIQMLSTKAETAKFILWNGPLGNFEKGFSQGTEALAVAIGRTRAHSIVGGGDTVAAIERGRLAKNFSYLSTSGGAMLEFIAHGTLPGIRALKSKK